MFVTGTLSVTPPPLTITANSASKVYAQPLPALVIARLLGVPPLSPVLRCERITTDTSGRPVLMSVHVFPAHRTEFVVELPTAEPSITPSGLRLVE